MGATRIPALGKDLGGYYGKNHSMGTKTRRWEFLPCKVRAGIGGNKFRQDKDNNVISHHCYNYLNIASCNAISHHCYYCLNITSYFSLLYLYFLCQSFN